MWAPLTLYQARRSVVVEAAESVPGTDPDRCYSPVALQSARDQAEHGHLIFLALPARLTDLPAAAVADRPGEPVAGLLHGELPVHQTPVGVVDRVDHGEQVHGLVGGRRGPGRRLGCNGAPGDGFRLT